MSVREDQVSRAGPCAACGHGDFFAGKCRVCGKPIVSTDKAEEPLEPPTSIPLSPERLPITFTVGDPPRIDIKAPAVGRAACSGTLRVHSDVSERISRRHRVGLVICSAVALALPVFVAQFSNLASPDPLSEFSAITGVSLSDVQIEDWSRRQFSVSSGLETTDRIARAKSALEQRMAAALARDARQPMDWSQVASWANIARALGVYDTDMLELSADLNVQVAIYGPEIPEVDGLGRLARARSLLQMRREVARDSSEVMRLERKLTDLDEMEFKIREIRGRRR